MHTLLIDRSIGIGRDDLAAAGRDQRSLDDDVEAFLEKSNRAVTQKRIHTAGVKAEDLVVGPGTVACRRVRRGILAVLMAGESPCC